MAKKWNSAVKKTIAAGCNDYNAWAE